MANDLVKFEFEGRGVRTVVIKDEPWFVAKDVCDILGLVNSREAVANLEEDELRSVTLTSGGQRREMTALSESGLYALIFKSRKENAKRFRKWVTGEVLPQIRKTGKYEVAPEMPKSLPEALRAYADALEREQLLLEDKTELEVRLDEAKEWYSIKRMEKLNFPRKFDWRELKRESHRLRKPIKKVFDQNYDEVNAYHLSVWESLYFDTLNFE